MVKNGIDPNNNSGMSLLGVGKEEEYMAKREKLRSPEETDVN
jgi:hypothetical protein